MCGDNIMQKVDKIVDKSLITGKDDEVKNFAHAIKKTFYLRNIVSKPGVINFHAIKFKQFNNHSVIIHADKICAFMTVFSCRTCDARSATHLCTKP